MSKKFLLRNEHLYGYIVIQVWDDVRGSKWWQNLDFWMNYPFKEVKALTRHVHMFTCLIHFSESIDLLFNNPSQNLILIMSALMLNSLCFPFTNISW